MKNVLHSVLRFIVIVAILSFPGYLLAQHTTVTAQVKDPTNQLYRTCTGSANFIGQNTVPGAGPYTLGGGTFQTVVPINCDGSARFTISLADNNIITPTPSQWQFTICTAIGVYTGPVICFTGLITITGATQDITAALQAISAPLPPYSAILETNGVPNGSQSLLNLISGTNITIVDNGVGGVTISSTGGGGGGGGGCTPAGGTGALQVNNGSGGCVGVNGVAAGSALVSNGVGTAPVFQAKAIVDVRDYTGADWCAKVNTADTVFLGVNAILNVPSAMSGLTACTTTITLTSGHALEFGSGSFDLGTQTSRAGIVIGSGVNNVDIGGAGRQVTNLYFTSNNVGAGNGYPMGSAIAVGTSVGCVSAANAANQIHIHDIHLIDRNAGSALGPAFNPSGITGICDNNVTIENNQFTDIKGNAAITLTGSWSTFTTASNYQDRNNIFDGTTGGGGGEFTADNSANWTNFSMSGNTISDYPCGIGVSHGFNGIITGNVIDLTLKAKFGNCPGIGLGSSDDTVGDLTATNNIITMGSNSLTTAVIGIGIFPKAAASGSTEMVISGNTIRQVANGVSGPAAAISLNGTNVGQNPPTMVARHNTTTTDYAVQVSGNQVSNIEVSDNDFEGSGDHGNVPFFNCPGLTTPAIKSGSTVRVYSNRFVGTNPGGVAEHCQDASFNTRQFQEWSNTIGDGNPSTNFAASGFLGKNTRLLWTPGTITAYTSSSNQVVTVTQAIAGDQVKISNFSGATGLSLPAGVIASGVVTSANTVTFNITNTTAAPVTINSGSQIASYVIVDRPPNNTQTISYSLNSSITLGASPNTSAQIGPVTARTGAFNGTPSVIIQEEAGNNPLEIHTTHQTGIDLYSHDATSGLRGPAIDFLRSRGTQAAPAAVLNGDLFTVINIGGYDGTGYFAPQIIGYGATENWNATSHGLGAAFAVIPNGTIAPTNAMVLNNNGSVTFPNAVTAASYTASGVNGGLSGTEGTGAGVPPGAGLDVVWADSTAHRWLMNNNNESTSERVAGTYASGNVTTAGTVVNAGTCQAQTGITITGALTTDNVVANIGAALPATWQTGIVLSAHVTAGNTVTVYLCNPSAGNITPAATQVNVRILR